MKPEIEYRPKRGGGSVTKAVTVTGAVTHVTQMVTAEAVGKFEVVRAEACPTCGHVAVRPALTPAQKQAAYRARRKAVQP